MASSNSNLSERIDRAQSVANMTSNQGGSSEVSESTGRPPIWCRNRSPKPGTSTPQQLLPADTGRTIEQVVFILTSVVLCLLLY